jgi:hypothetical protein
VTTAPDSLAGALNFTAQRFVTIASELDAARTAIAEVRRVCAHASTRGNHIDGVSVVKVPDVLAALGGLREVVDDDEVLIESPSGWVGA